MNYPFKSKPPSVSLCMIVKNEEFYLRDCLKSVADLVDEIVVIDTGSDDKTLEILHEFGVEPHTFAWINDFAAARNEALKYASCDWIFQIDADERLLPESRNELRRSLRNKKATTISVLIDSPKAAGKGHISRAHRLFRNLPGIGYSGRIHEQISPSVAKLRGREGESNIRLHHLGYEKSEAEMQAKSERNYRLLKKQVEDEPNHPYWHFTLAQNQILSGSYEDALLSLNRALELGQLPKDITCSIFNNLAEVHMRLRKFPEAIQFAHKALAVTAKQSTSHLLLLQIYGHLSDRPQQIRCLEAVVDLREKKIQALHEVSLEAYVDETAIYLNLGRFYSQERRFEQALATFQKILRRDPENLVALKGIAEASLELGRFEQAQSYFEQLQMLSPKDPQILEKLAWLYIKVQDFKKAIKIYSELQRLQPENVNIRKRLAALYYKTGDAATGQEYLAALSAN